MKFLKVNLLLLVLIFCFTLTAGAVDTQQIDVEISEDNTVILEIETAQDSDISDRSITPVGDISYNIVRENHNSEICQVYAVYTGETASYLRFDSMTFGPADISKRSYDSLPGKMYSIGRPQTYFQCLLGTVHIPLDIFEVAVRSKGLQVYVMPSGIWTVASLRGRMAEVN